MANGDWGGVATGLVATGLAAGPTLILAGAGAGLLAGRGWQPRFLRSYVQAALGLAAVTALAATLLLTAGVSPVTRVLDGPGPWDLEFYWDPLAAVALLLVTHLGLVIGSFSLRQLQGDPGQVRFLRWLLWTLAGTALLVVAGNLALFALAWLAVSLSLHQLLTFYPDRPWAIWAARKKFLISRLGDLLLLAALAATYAQWGTWSFSELFAAAGTLADDGAGVAPLVSLLGLLFVLAAMTKSAQIPFHSWLPDTMETPTPVSALMHAGVINAGGYLILRLNPLVTWSSAGMGLLVVVGGLTALVASVVMLTQTSVKRGLAYSTIAQMGFMLLQCGLAAWGAAVLHLVAHALYKSYAFLASGSVLREPRELHRSPPHLGTRPSAAVRWGAVLAAASLVAGSTWLCGYDVLGKPGALLLGLVLALAVAQLLRRAWSDATPGVARWGIVRAALLCCMYFAAVRGIEWLLAESFREAPLATGPWYLTAVVVTGLGFLAVYFLHDALAAGSASHRLRQLYVHAAHGFYLDIPVRQLTARVWGRATPTP